MVKKVGMEVGKKEIVLSPSLIPDPEAETVKSSKADSIGKPSIPCYPSGVIQTCWTDCLYLKRSISMEVFHIHEHGNTVRVSAFVSEL